MKTDRNRFVAFAFCWADILLELDADRCVLFVAGAVERVIGKQPAALIGIPARDLVIETDRLLIDNLLNIADKRGRVDDMTLRLLDEEDEPVSVNVVGYRFEDLGGHYYVALRSLAGQVAGDMRPKDRETGLYGVEHFSDIASRRLKEAQKQGRDAELTLVSLPTLGALQQRLDESAGLALNQTIGAALKAVSIDGDSAAGLGEGRYALISDAALDTAQLRNHLGDITKDADPTGEGAQAEVAQADLPTADFVEEDLAAGLVYAINQFSAQQGGAFSLAEFSRNLGSMVVEAQTAVNSFKDVVSDANFDIAFHPILSIQDGAIQHYEALVRFRGDMGGQSPFRYINFAEETGLIWRFDIAMLRKVLEWLRQQQDKQVSVAVNVSGNSIGNLSFLNALQGVLKTNIWARGRLLFEVTESARIDNLEETDRVLQNLRKQGFKVCLDDFGAGAASFQYLTALEVDIVKLDGESVQNARKARKGRALMTSMTRLCSDLGVKTVAEMIDDEAGLEFVRDCGVDCVQGYLFGLPSTDFKDVMRRTQLSAKQLFRGE
mgnify:CR=1 FL=1